MKKNQFRFILISTVLIFGLLTGMAWADNSNQMVYSDGREVSAAAPSAVNGDQPAFSKGFTGTGTISQEILQELAQTPGIYTTTPDGVPFEDVVPMTPYGPATESMEVVKGTDSRSRNYGYYYPNRAVVKISFSTPTGTGGCTGWMISPDTVATAGHCVHSGGPGGVWYSNWTVYPGRDASYLPYGSVMATWAGSVYGWTLDGKEAYDYGVLKLASDIGLTVGTFGYMWKSGGLGGYPTIITGYPGDKPYGEQWDSADKVRVSKTKQIFYNNDTAGGMSGSPIWYDRGTMGPMGIGIHAYGFPHKTGPHAKYNHGTRITRARFNNLQDWGDDPK